MITKLIEIRDRATLIVALAIKLNKSSFVEGRFFDRAGYADGHILLMRLEDCLTCNNPYDWNTHTSARTMKEAHIYIERNFDSLKNGDVVDVEYVLNEVATPKSSDLLPL
jgi:hypothetical protein